MGTLPEIAPTLGDTKWFLQDRFGLFIHWGLYALPARHEWVKNRERIPDEDYQRYFDHFDPDLYDPRPGRGLPKQAGMRYAVITTKHHEGFCLWDSAPDRLQSDQTPRPAATCSVRWSTRSAPRGSRSASTTR